MRRSVSEAALDQPEDPKGTDSLKNLTLHDLSLKSSSETSGTPELSLSAETLGPSKPSDVNFLLRPEDTPEEVEAQDELSPEALDKGRGIRATFPKGFRPRRSSQGPTQMPIYSSPIAKNPFMSPLLAPESMLQTLPPVHIVVSARWSSEEGGWDAGAPVEESSGEGGKVSSRAPRDSMPPGRNAWQWKNGRESGLQFSFAILLGTLGPWGSHRAWRVREGNSGSWGKEKPAEAREPS